MAKTDLRSILDRDDMITMDATYRAAFSDYLDRVNEALQDNLVDLFDVLIGEPRKNRSAREGRWRAVNGNEVVSVVFRGHKAGQWFDFAESKGSRYPLQAVRHFLGVDFRAALDWAADRYGLPRFDNKGVRRESAEKLAKDRAERERKRAEKAAKAAKEEAEQLNKDLRTVEDIVARTVPCAGSIGETYLRNARRLEEVRAFILSERGATVFPDSVRWSPADQALVFVVTDQKGAPVGVQFVAVTPEGEQDRERWGVGKKATGKKSRGPISLGSVKFPAFRKGGPIIFAEGPETGLSIWIATGFEVRVVLGVSGFKRVINEAPRDQKIILARDDDSTDKQSYKAAVAGLTMLANAGFDVWDVWPFNERRQNGADFNDLLKEQGLDAIAERLLEAMEDQRAFGRIEHKIMAAECLVDSRVGEFFDAAQAHKEGETPIVYALGVDTGGGKTHSAICKLIKFLTDLRAKGDTRSVVILVPEHKLSRQVANRIRDELRAAGSDLQVAIWRGREATRFDDADPSRKMCDELDMVRLADEMLADVDNEVCAVCPHGPKNANTCAYLAQRGLVADIWVGSHQLMWRTAPQAITRNAGIAALIVDEDMLGAGVRDPFELPISSIEGGRLPENEDDRLDLMDYRHRLAAILDAAEDGFLRKDALAAHPDYSIGYKEACEAIELEWSRKVTRKQERDWRGRNANIGLTKAVSLAKAVADLAGPHGPEASGLVRVGRNKERARVVWVSHRATVHPDWAVPTLIMDAMHKDTKILEHFWPQVEDKGCVNIATPHQTIHQVVDRSYSLSWLAPPKKKRRKKGEVDPETFEPVDPEMIAIGSDDRARATQKNRREVAASIVRLHRQNGGQSLLICNKDVATSPEIVALKTMFPAESGIEVAWFGAMAGRDEWKDVRSLFVLGRPLPSPSAVETMAATLTGRAVETLEPGETRRSTWYRRERAFRFRRDGRDVFKVPAETDCHPDPMVERLRWQECVGAIMQAIGRGRGTRRAADKPVDVFVLTDAVLPVAVDQFLLAEDIEPTLADLQLAAGGVAFENGSCAAAAYPDLWPSAKAFTAAKIRENEREEGGRANWRFLNNRATNSYRYIYTGTLPCSAKTHNSRLVQFQLAGPKQHRQAAVYDPAICPDPRAFIEAKAGPLEWIFFEPGNDDAGEVEALPVAVNAAPIAQTPAVPPNANDTSHLPTRSPVAVARSREAAEPIVLTDPAADSPVEEAADVETIPPDLWARLWTHARNAGRSHGDVAAFFGVSLPYLSNMEAGRRSCRALSRERFEEFFATVETTQGSLF